ncbi:multidrug efflux RND transporter permease subunit [Altericroceibacterium spongiae]|uniref:Multidrug efflux RND transporter permease subunit n=1 Tax=Altericroceibacterium spongiae TaxID=2320269 RepID=A0A420ERM7_9SPHN|nr:efflux RND transporter permease subunit [Altericroceibacterium spongiae]RKF23321.1 multidrug efflux RND transporter permease subunit [Altericroceibacterium spongiae]
MARFFIDRPVFAWVVALFILLMGLIALRSLPIEQYPEVAPPSVTISVTYPGADAETIENNVTKVIEQELNGVDGYLYMASANRSNGTAEITVTFESGTDIDIAQTEIQNRLSTIEARLPESVRQQGISIRQANSNFLAIVALTSKSGTMSATDLGNVANSQVIDELRRVPGVGDVRLFGSAYAMRIWLDPDKLASYNISPAQVVAEIEAQNAASAGGSIGAMPSPDGQQITATIRTQGRFSTVQEFKDIILRSDTDTANVRLGDVARVELGAETYATSVELDGKPMAGLAVQLATGANALDTAEGVNQRMEEVARSLPEDVQWSIPFDTTPFIEVSVHEVVKTLIEAMVLVFLVMFLFLQNWRATLIPTLVVPIALAGACLGLWIFGFSINVLTLFGMVLAIGILVDDAIVVIENVERIMSEEGLDPIPATRKAMDQITGAIIGITLVLIAVFLPMVFFPGSTGAIYRQFSATLSVSIFFSALMALILTPALCAHFLKPVTKGGHAHNEGAEGSDGDTPSPAAEEPIEGNGPRAWMAKASRYSTRFFSGFNRWFSRTTDKYGRANARVLSRPMRSLAVFLALVAVTAVLFLRLPGGFLPDEDQGYLLTVVQTPPGSSAERTDEALNEVGDFWQSKEEVAHLITIHGFNFFGQGENNGMIFAPFTPWEERPGSEHSSLTIMGEATARFGQLSDAIAYAFQPPPITALGNATGFQFKLEDRAGLGREELTRARDQILGQAMQSEVLTNVRPEDQPPAPQLKLNIDRLQARALGLSMSDVNNALSINFGSAYVNDFDRDGRVLRVMVQADKDYRKTAEDLKSLRIPNDQGELVPFSAFAQSEWDAASIQLARYNGYPAMTISGESAAGYSSGAALEEMERIASNLPDGLDYEWTGISYEEKQAGGQVGALLGLSVIVVFLLLAALYESWAVPFSVLLIVPMGILGAVLFTMLRGLSADIYFNVGLITIIGLAAKNAILIVEFAIEAEGHGKKPLDAVKEAAHLRLRPIIMTSLAFILGMVPLALSSGAGAASRIAVGTGVMGGMIAATAFGIFFIPLLYLLVRRYISRAKPEPAEMHEHDYIEPGEEEHQS